MIACIFIVPLKMFDGNVCIFEATSIQYCSITCTVHNVGRQPESRSAETVAEVLVIRPFDCSCQVALGFLVVAAAVDLYRQDKNYLFVIIITFKCDSLTHDCNNTIKPN